MAASVSQCILAKFSTGGLNTPDTICKTCTGWRPPLALSAAGEVVAEAQKLPTHTSERLAQDTHEVL